VDPQLGSGIPTSSKGCDRDQLPAPQVQSLPRVDVAKRELDHHAGEVGRNLCDAAFEEVSKLFGCQLLGDVDAPAITVTH